MARALDRNPGVATLLMAGGVACNSLLRERIEQLMQGRGGQAYIPGPLLCTDNAAMIAIAGYYKYLRAEFTGQDVVPLARL